MIQYCVLGDSRMRLLSSRGFFLYNELHQDTIATQQVESKNTRIFLPSFSFLHLCSAAYNMLQFQNGQIKTKPLYASVGVVCIISKPYFFTGDMQCKDFSFFFTKCNTE